MSEFIANTFAGGVTGLVLVAIFSFLSGYGMRGVGTAILIVFFGSIFIAHNGYVAFGLLVAILMIWAVWVAKIFLQK